MGNKHSSNRENGYKARGAKVDTTTGSTFHTAALKTRGSPSANKPPVLPSSSTTTTTASPKKSFDPDRCYAWFKTYTGLEDDEEFDPEQIGPNGIAKLCEDIGASLEAVDMLVLAYHLEADTMQRLKEKMPGLVAKLKDAQHFKDVYRFIFMFAKDSDQKCMPLEASQHSTTIEEAFSSTLDTACAMVQTVMKGKPHEKRFVEFLETKKPVKVINKDQWYNLLDFSDSVNEDLSNYDGASSAWPVLLDEYVEWRNETSS
ncbi:hypothetical protein BGX31_010605 [Mortierella sp. GBA43]|nr:hypothetical protein BGX31_010605 [Mortierella sp. GBA43]